MNPSGMFWKMVHHEFKLKGSWKGRSRLHLSKGWVFLYLALIVIVGAGITTYYSVHYELPLKRLWSVWIGVPYVLIAFGVAILKREWENETYGWWLTLPYSRLWLVSAKWIAAWLRMLVAVLSVFALLSIYALAISISLSLYTLAEVESFILTGLQWLLLMIGFSPFLLAVSLLIAGTQFSSLRPLSPILWAGFVGGISYAFGGLGKFFPDSPTARSLTEAAWHPIPWEVPAGMGASWIAAYFIIRFTAYVLELKLTL
ncbi:ABC transporter permease subunit [Paenibacillus sp. GP183]|uniref:ABC transporter permease subunit n=1 Tax=Paenibacillus sp. GP183 TaxID=1882751 RepID=UPI0008963C51|nr:ABC transporter permease subunit [Paenibacillus sp. GP183]SEC40857.1 ABC-2 type transport system permease protein [Paenibacillus sp. GP183]